MPPKKRTTRTTRTTRVVVSDGGFLPLLGAIPAIAKLFGKGKPRRPRPPKANGGFLLPMMYNRYAPTNVMQGMLQNKLPGLPF